MNKHKFRLFSLLSLLTLAFTASAVFAFASWQFNATDASNNNTAAVITDWEFEPVPPVEPGQTITVDSDGNITIDGQPVDNIEVTYPDGQEPRAGGGSITYNIGVVDGQLVVTDYTATDLASSFFSTNAVATLPASITIDGHTYPIMGLSQPISLEVQRVLLGGAVTINIPEGYRYICDNAFQDLTSNRSSTATINLPSTLEYLGNASFKMNIRNLTIQIQYAGTKAQFNALVEASKAEYGTDYVFFTGATGNVTIACSDGDAIYNRNGVYQG